jgi:hypothetical protein
VEETLHQILRKEAIGTIDKRPEQREFHANEFAGGANPNVEGADIVERGSRGTVAHNGARRLDPAFFRLQVEPLEELRLGGRVQGLAE